MKRFASVLAGHYAQGVVLTFVAECAVGKHGPILEKLFTEAIDEFEQ